MTTVKQLERQWNAKAYGKLFRDLVLARGESAFAMDAQPALPARTAALTLIRLVEISQPHVALATQLIRTLVCAQEADGGWGDPPTTALCLRALLCCDGNGGVIDCGLAYLANLQRDDGLWPAGPLRRMPGDLVASAFILYELGGNIRFRAAVRFGDARAYFESRASRLDPIAARAWTRAEPRCRVQAPPLAQQLFAARFRGEDLQ